MGLNDLAFGADGPGLYNLGLKDSGLNNRGADGPVTHTLTNSKHLDNYFPELHIVIIIHSSGTGRRQNNDIMTFEIHVVCKLEKNNSVISGDMAIAIKYLQKVQGQKYWQEMEPYYINVLFAFTALLSSAAIPGLVAGKVPHSVFTDFFRIDQSYLASVWPPKTKDTHRWYPNRSSCSKIQSKRGWYWHFGRRKQSGMQGIDVNINKPDLCYFLFYLRECLPVPKRQWGNFILTMNANAAKPSKV